jgi:hypothetical protein
MSGLPAWVPVELPWKHVRPGDAFVGREQKLWHVARCAPSQGQIAIQVVQVDEPINTYADPDETVQVLVPVSERDCAELLVGREQIAARLIERRTS